MTGICNGCGDVRDSNYPSSVACNKCPERDCPDCGERVVGAFERVDGTGSCSCWTLVEDIPLADLKASLARDNIGLDLDGKLTL